MSTRILNKLPPFYQDIIEMMEIDQAETMEMEALEQAIQRGFDDQFVWSASEEALKRREVVLDIQADPTTEDIDFRRKRILHRYQTKPPFTLRFLQHKLDALVGEGVTIVSIDPEQFILYVTTNIEDGMIFREVQHTVHTIKPANMVYQQNTSLGDTVGIEETIEKQTITWNYELGKWKLGEQAFITLSNKEVVI
ncbi:putative phage tail protein [Longirhabdus pacifica]|uniref:putative phage tail protein n=1 Tax=Longirhabdus pacifica TaxID=2305227 RepID=UPI0010093968|nr:putative phage tail protein [Longirhabdus pacifica]